MEKHGSRAEPRKRGLSFYQLEITRFLMHPLFGAIGVVVVAVILSRIGF